MEGALLTLILILSGLLLCAAVVEGWRWVARRRRAECISDAYSTSETDLF